MNRVSRFERFHFNPDFEVEVDPEYPGNGDWGGPVYFFDREGRHPEAVVSSWGATLVVRISTESSSWVGMFAEDGPSGVRGVFACPSRSSLCVGNDGLVHVVDVHA